MFIDTHTHLYLDDFSDDLEAVMKRALDTNIEKFFLPNIDSSTIGMMMGLCSKYKDICYPMMGLHPCSVNAGFRQELDTVREWLRKEKFYAIGETGIDLYWDKSFLTEQEIAFREQIALAKQYKLPIVIHARDSFDEILRILDDENDENLSGIFHCFTGTAEQAEKIIAYSGFYLGIGGVVTFKNAGLSQSLKNIPLQFLVLETDSPYLAPVPYRGKRNESSYLTYVATTLASVYNCTVKEIADITSANARKVFNL